MWDKSKQESNIINSVFPKHDSWVILSPIEQRIKEKIEKIGIPLKEWDIKINYGIKTGCNEAFIIDKVKRDELIKESANSADIIRPILRGKDIQRYSYNFANLYLINAHNGIKEKNIPPIDIDEYPAIKKHLDKYWNKISNREDQGKTPYNLRNCAYMDEFSKQKVIWKRVGSVLRFAFDSTGLFILDSACFATGSYAKYLTVVLNSKIGKYMLQNAPMTGTGDLLISVQAIEPLKIPLPDSRAKAIIENYVDELHLSEQDVNTIIYSLYSLSKDEIAFVEKRIY